MIAEAMKLLARFVVATEAIASALASGKELEVDAVEVPTEQAPADPPKGEEKAETPDYTETPKEKRARIKKGLDELGVEYNASAGTKGLEAKLTKHIEAIEARTEKNPDTTEAAEPVEDRDLSDKERQQVREALTGYMNMVTEKHLEDGADENTAKSKGSEAAKQLMAIHGRGAETISGLKSVGAVAVVNACKA